MGVTSNETVLIVSDEQTREIGLALHEAGNEIGKESFYVEMKKRALNGQEPPEQITEMMQKVDVVICATTRSLTHTNARRMATAAKVRVGTMPGITVPIMSRCFAADSNQIIETNNKLIKILHNTKEIRLTTALGTDATFSAVGRKVISSTGVLKNPADWGNIPSGEVYFAPVEDNSYGKLVCDGSISGIGMLEEPVIIDIKEGMITKISGGKQAKEFDNMLSKVGGKAKAVAEFGVGTNPKAKICGLILEDEKVLGTVHIAFGNNISMEGSINVPIHIDCIIKSPSFTVDGKKIMEKGKLLI
jgi:leucyl aminopeptidase (aminopeptidase T)